MILCYPYRVHRAALAQLSLQFATLVQVDYTTNLLSSWTTLTNFVGATNGVFRFADDGTNSGGFGGAKFYQLRVPP